MTKEEFHAVYPILKNWIVRTLSSHAANMVPVTSFGFPRLGHYYRPSVLAGAKVVAVDKVPMPPLAAMGLRQFSAFESLDSVGVTYLDTYLVQKNRLLDESLHFHELVHILQWQILGPEAFVATYAGGLERYGYRDSPLEVIAYNLQARFESDKRPFDVEEEVRCHLKFLGF